MKPAVLFLCTGNSARSQMAEGFLRKWAGDRFVVRSAGLIRVMKEIGINIRAYRSKHVREFLGEKDFAYLITLSDETHRVTITGFSECVHWIVEDPAAATGDEAARLEKFRQVRDQIGVRIQKWLENVRRL